MISAMKKREAGQGIGNKREVAGGGGEERLLD